MKNRTTIVLKRTTKGRLDKLIEKKGDTYDDIVNRLLDKVEGLEK